MDVVVSIELQSGRVGVPSAFGDERLRAGSRPRERPQVQRDEVLPVVTVLIKTHDLPGGVIPLTAVHPLQDVCA